MAFKWNDEIENFNNVNSPLPLISDEEWEEMYFKLLGEEIDFDAQTIFGKDSRAGQYSELPY